MRARTMNKFFKPFLVHIDSFLMGCLFFTLMVGLLVLYSASGQDLSKVYDQTVNILLAFSVMWLVANIAPHQLERIAMPLYVLGVVLLVAVELVGSTSHGAQRWLNL